MSTPIIPSKLRSQLWKHQREACVFALEALRGTRAHKACLLRLPTGTGKTGIIATLSIAVPPLGWTLILTPWRNLVEQMIADLSQRFWQRVQWAPTPRIEVGQLLPKTIEEELAAVGEHRVLVATFASLMMIRKRQRPLYDQLAGELGQIIVDEGHYEPAVEWGQAVKQLKQPTVLLTATPYRNDLKLFRVEEKAAHHYTHREAEHDCIIRDVQFAALPVDEPAEDELAGWCAAFAKAWKKLRQQAHATKGPRAIVCCAKMTTVERVTKLLRDEHGLSALGIHDRFSQSGKPWLVMRTPDPHQESSEIWVHQNKLTEGLDDSRFCVLAVCNRIRNDRKLVQQIGRVLRTIKAGQREHAFVLYSRDLPVERSWRNYRDFEVQKDLAAPERYRTVFETLIAQQPEMEYFGGRFRKRFDPDSPNLPEQVRLPAAALVRRVGRDFSFDELAEYTSDFLLLEDRILLGPDQDCFAPAKNARLWVYAVMGNSPLQIEHSLYEIRLGVSAAVLHDGTLFLIDSEGRYPMGYLEEHARKISPDTLGRIFGKRIIPKEIALANPWPAGPAVRRTTLMADNLGSTPSPLTDAALVCASARATVLPSNRKQARRRQYLGFLRGRISEELQSAERSEFCLSEFIAWTGGLASDLTKRGRKSPEFFRRFLATVEPPASPVPSYFVVNLFGPDLELQDASQQRLELAEPIVEVTSEINAQGKTEFASELVFRSETGQEEAYRVTLGYDPQHARFTVRGEALNVAVLVCDRSKPAADADGICNFLNREDEEFTIALRGGDIFYTAQAFYRLDYSGSEQRVGGMIKSFATLSTTTSEKGSPAPAATTWPTHTVFRTIDNLTSTGLLRLHFGPVEWLFCDDLQTEAADFICADFSRRKIAFIHAKCADGRLVSASALHDVVAQGLKNLGHFSRNAPPPPNIANWNRAQLWGASIRRWRRGAVALPENEAMWQKIREDILEHPDGVKEVWLVVGQTLVRANLMEQFANANARTAQTGQVFHLLSSLSASASHLSVRVRVFCD